MAAAEACKGHICVHTYVWLQEACLSTRGCARETYMSTHVNACLPMCTHMFGCIKCALHLCAYSACRLVCFQSLGLCHPCRALVCATCRSEPGNVEACSFLPPPGWQIVLSPCCSAAEADCSGSLVPSAGLTASCMGDGFSGCVHLAVRGHGVWGLFLFPGAWYTGSQLCLVAGGRGLTLSCVTD